MLLGGAYRAAYCQSTSATFGTVISLGGTPSDIVLDESRGKLYLVNSSANRVDVYDYVNQQKLSSIPVGSRPLAAAMSMDNAYLYVTNNTSSTVSVIDLRTSGLVQTVTVPAKPDGVEVGSDGRAVISTEGSGTSNLNNTLLIFDRNQPLGQQVIPVTFPPPAATPAGLPAVAARPATTFKGKLLRTPDGNFIIGVSVVNNNTQTVTYVYEVSSGTILNSRYVTGQSTTLSVSPDGSKFMAGYTLYDRGTLGVIGQFNAANAPFTLGTINTTTNVGGSAFSADGSTLYGAFNVAATVIPAAAPLSSTLLVSDPTNLGIKLGIKLPESIVARIVTTADGTKAFGLSSSGVMYLPLSTLYNHPILQPATTSVFLRQDDCNRGVATASLPINNAGQGTLTFSVPNPGNALEAQAVSGMAPSSITFTMDPGRSGVIRQPGTNLYTGGAANAGTPVALSVSSAQAINIPNTILVYMNYRQSDQRGVIYNVPLTPSTAEGLQDIVFDPVRQKVYVTNSGYNRVEIFDIASQQFTTPISVGQLPHTMALGLDGNTLYVANTGGESVSIVDLDAQQVTGSIGFPAIPRAGATNPNHVVAMAMGQTGLQFALATTNTTGSTASQWEVIAGQAVLRQADSIAVNPANTAQNVLPTPLNMVGTPGGENILTLNGSGTAYLFDGLNDAYTASTQLFNTPITGYYGPLGAAPGGSFFLANNLVLTNAITSTITEPGTRNVAAVAPIDQSTFLRLTTPARTTNGGTTADDPRTLLEFFDLNSGGETLIGATAENPAFEVFGTTRVNLAPRQMVVDNNNTAYAITLSGLSVIPLTPSNDSTRPQLAATKVIVNSNSGTASVAPGSFVTINGTHLAAPATATQLPVPTVLGGSCVTFNNVAAPLLQTASGSIQAQIPTSVTSGVTVMQVRSLATGQASDPVTVTLAKQ